MAAPLHASDAQGANHTVPSPAGGMDTQRSRVVHACLLAIPVLLQSCVYVPITTTRYDADCQILARHMTMEPVQVAQLSSCSNAQCTDFMVVAGFTAAASAVISGSIVIVGNVVYWLEKQGRCLPKE